MTQHGHVPTDSNTRFHTSYEQSQLSNAGAGFGYDGLSCCHVDGVWPNIGDVESLTLLSGLEQSEPK